MPGLTVNEIVTFAAKQEAYRDIQAAKHLITTLKQNQVFTTEKSLSACADIGAKHEAIALQLISDKEFINACRGEHLATLGQPQTHSKIYEEIIQNKAFFSRLEGGDLARLSAYHVDLAQRVLSDPDLLAKCTGFNLTQMGKVHFEIALKIFQTPKLFNKCSSQNLATLAIQYEEITQNFWNILDSKCTENDKMNIAGRQPRAVIENLINLPALQPSIQPRQP